MKQTFWQKVMGQAGGSPPPAARGTTIVREERGSGTGAVLFRPYSVSEFIPDPASGPLDGADPPGRVTAPTGSGSPAGEADGMPPAEVAPPPPPPDDAGAAAPRTPNPVADEWRRGNPDMFRTVARRFCARAPIVARDLRDYCLSGQHQRLARLAASLKPTLGLYDMTAADAAERVEHGAATPRPELARDVLALEDEVWRVAEAWGHVDQARTAAPVEVAS